jgi:hypothetical protein
LDWLRVAVATRPLAAGDPYRPAGHLHGLGVTMPGSRNLVDLDHRFFDASGLVAYADALLAQEGFARPGPAGAAWERYREHPDVRLKLAQVVAQRADRNFLVAGMASFQLAEDQAMLNPGLPAFDPSVVPSRVGEALAKYLDGLREDVRYRVRGLLTALSYGRGAGLDDRRWLAFAKALGWDEVTTADLAGLRDSPAADYLLESPTGSGVTRLYHQALADELTLARDRRKDEQELVKLLEQEAGATGWAGSASYVRQHAPNHAAAAGQLERLTGEAAFLVGVAPDAMRPVLRRLGIGRLDEPAAIYDLALPFLGDHPGDNAAVLEVISRVQGNRKLAERLGELTLDRPYRAIPRLRPLDRALARFDGHTRGVLGVAALAWPGIEHPVLATASEDGTARVWDPQDPEHELARFDGHTSAVLGWPRWPGPGSSTPSWRPPRRMGPRGCGTRRIPSTS